VRAAPKTSFGPRFASVVTADVGATLVEYVIVLILIALAVMLAVRFFGQTVGQKYDCAGARLDDMSGTFQKAGCTANTPTPIPTPTPLPPPPPPPLPADPLGPQARHHIGDGNCSGPRCGGNTRNEGTSFALPFSLTQEQIDFANRSSGGVIRLQFVTSGIDYPTDKVIVDGLMVGGIVDGTNVITLNAAGLGAGSHTVTFSSGLGSLVAGAPLDFDDFELSGIRVTF
jgi:Flp pilus assembly pilin Flp